VVGAFDDLEDAEELCAELNASRDITAESVPADMMQFLAQLP
jgi:hypothetical protein